MKDIGLDPFDAGALLGRVAGRGRRRLGAGLAALAVAAGLVAGCGGDGDGDDALVDERSAEQIVADFELASSGLLTIEDLPDGWKGEPSDTDPTLNTRLAACLDSGDPTVVLNDAAEASNQFGLGDASIASLVNVYPDEAYAEASFEPVFDPEYADCYREVLRLVFGGRLPAGGTMDLSGSVDELDLGDEAATLHLEVRLSVDGQERTTSIRLDLVRIGRVAVSLQTSDVGRPFDDALADDLLAIVVDRIATL